MSMVVDTCEVFCLFDSYIINGASHVLGFGWCDELVNQQWKTKSLGTMACDYAFTSLLFCVCTCGCVGSNMVVCKGPKGERYIHPYNTFNNGLVSFKMSGCIKNFNI